MRAMFLSGDVDVNVEIVKMKTFVENGAEKSIVYGLLTFKGLKQPTEKLNLTCIEIFIDNAKSEAIYVDSVAHILPDRYLLNSGKDKLAVYWKMDKAVKASVATGFKVSGKDGCKLILSN